MFAFCDSSVGQIFIYAKQLANEYAPELSAHEGITNHYGHGKKNMTDKLFARFIEAHAARDAQIRTD